MAHLGNNCLELLVMQKKKKVKKYSSYCESVIYGETWNRYFFTGILGNLIFQQVSYDIYVIFLKTL